MFDPAWAESRQAITERQGAECDKRPDTARLLACQVEWFRVTEYYGICPLKLSHDILDRNLHHLGEGFFVLILDEYSISPDKSMNIISSSLLRVFHSHL